MQLAFYKFQGAGNDFVMVDNRKALFSNLTQTQIQCICARKYGVGSDGLILINNSLDCDFEMVFFNPDASQSFCGNGARCAVAFAKQLGIECKLKRFSAIDGIHEYTFEQDIIGIHMADVDHIEVKGKEEAFVHTGSPHYILFNDDLSSSNVLKLGQKIRYSETYIEEGVNVNLMRIVDNKRIEIATYERGVENETLACGTGATACALFFGFHQNLSEGPIAVQAKGGLLSVDFKRNEDRFNHVWLFGPATFVYQGTIELL